MLQVVCRGITLINALLGWMVRTASVWVQGDCFDWLLSARSGRSE
jgi:hypothetical protein